jgi:hypothetical protein
MNIFFCVLLRMNGLVLPVVVTQCTLRSKNTGYLPHVDRGRVNCIHKKLKQKSRIPGTEDRIVSIQIFDMSRSESTVTYYVPPHYFKNDNRLMQLSLHARQHSA